MKSALTLILICALAFFLTCSEAQARGSNLGNLVILGDDLLMGGGLQRPEDHITQQLDIAIKDTYVKHFTVKLVAQKGGTTISSLALIPQVLAEKPVVVVVALGYNDALNRTDPDVVYNNLDTLLRELDRVGAYVLLLGVEAPVWMDHAYATRFNGIYPKISQRYRIMYHNGFLRGVQGDPELTQEDRYHPNRYGIAKIVENIIPGLEPMVKSLRRLAACQRQSSAYWCKDYLPQ